MSSKESVIVLLYNQLYIIVNVGFKGTKPKISAGSKNENVKMADPKRKGMIQMHMRRYVCGIYEKMIKTF